MKAPAFQFYVGDYMQDTRMISLAARGAWMDLLCAMWRSQNRGQLTSSILGYARLFGCTVEQAQTVIDEIVDSQVCDSVTHGDGKVTLTNRRMYREAKEREGANLRQKRYRDKERRESDAPGNGKSDAGVTPPSSSSSSTTKEKHSRRDAKASPRPANVIWDLGVTMLTNSGWTEGNARSFIGKQAKEYGNKPLAQAISATSSANPANPHEYLVKTLQGMMEGNGNAGGRGNSQTARADRSEKNVSRWRDIAADPDFGFAEDPTGSPPGVDESFDRGDGFPDAPRAVA